MDLSFLNNSTLKINLDADLRHFTTFRLGGSCPAVIECQDAGTLTQTVILLRERKIPFLIMGFGSNILASDQGIPVIMLRYCTEKPVLKISGNTLTTDASTQLDDLALAAINSRLDGLTAMSGIPGTVGGAIAGNAGAYGQQVADHLMAVTALMPDNAVITIPRNAIRFDYRDSDFKYNNAIILEASFALTPAEDITALHARRHDILETRRSKHGTWEKNPCAGSFFRNIEPAAPGGPRQAAGSFLERSGAKGLDVNGAHAYQNHANIITRDDGATAQDVYNLTLAMAKLVKTTFNIELVREVRLLGEFKNASTCNPAGFW